MEGGPEKIVEAAANLAEEAGDEPLVGTLDVMLLVVLAGVSMYYFFVKSNNKKDDPPPLKSFTISPTSLPPKTNDSSFVSKMKSSGRNVIVFYGSQTGTAEEFAGRLAKEATRWGMKGMVADPEECDMTQLSRLSEVDKHLAVFCMATYGEGDPTDNAQEFFEFLQAGDEQLEGIQYTVFGLGNKTYEHYNAMAKFVDKRMTDLGAQRVYELGMGDDDANMEDDFITWKDAMWPAVCEFFGIEAQAQDINMRQYRLTVHEECDPARLFTGEIARLNSLKIGNQRPPFDSKNPFMSEIKINRELFNGGERNCLHIELDIEGSRIRYDSGDHVAIYPINDQGLVDKLIRLTGEDADKVITLTNVDEDSSKKHPFPCPCTYRTALSHYVDITALPRTHVLKELAEYTTDSSEKEKLLLMSGTTEAGKAAYQQWVIQDVRNIIYILEDLPSCKPPLDYICELLPRLQARYYSISSSSKLYPTTIHVTANVLKYQTPTGRTNKGVCTNYLKGLVPDNGIKLHTPIFVRKSQFRLPSKPQIPIIMVGPGTGIAPFRGFIQERNLQREEGKPVGKSVLYFGCRNKAIDYLYEDELNVYKDSGLIELHLAFSRDQDNKVYVTHLMSENTAEIWKIIGEENGHLYVCGDAKSMARDVNSVIVKLCQTEGKMDQTQAELYVKKMITQKRYSSDVWS